MPPPRILVVRLGAMGDIVHALPAAASLQRSFADASIAWAVEPKWRALLDGGAAAGEIIEVDRRNWKSLRRAWNELRRAPFDFAIDFQGLIKSAVTGAAARPRRFYGFESGLLRERAAALFYTHRAATSAAHVVDRNLDLAAAAGACRRVIDFPLPAGCPEGQLPDGPFVLASPLAGWASKQWPLEHYAALARLVKRELGWPLVLNGAPASEEELRKVAGVPVHLSSVGGLIDATRRAAAVVGVDSGPLHLAAALARPGVALFGPTDPERNGPYGGGMIVLRAAGAPTTYRRGREAVSSMRALEPGPVFEALRACLARRVEA